MAKILGVALDVHLGGDINHPTDANQGVENHARDVVCDRTAIQLERAIDGGPDIFQIAKHIANALADPRRCAFAVQGGHRFDQRRVEGIVQAKHAPVERLQRVMWGNLRTAGTPQQSEQQPGEQKAMHCPTDRPASALVTD